MVFNRSFLDYGVAVLGEQNGVSFDYFIGSDKHLGKGLGVLILDLAVSKIIPEIDHEDRNFFVGHKKDNIKAIKCSEKAGFKYQRDFLEKNTLHKLYARDER